MSGLILPSSEERYKENESAYSYYESRYSEYMEQLLRIWHMADTWLLTLAGGAIGLSVTLATTVGAPTSSSLIALKICWGFCGTALLAALIAKWLLVVSLQQSMDILCREARTGWDGFIERVHPKLHSPRWRVIIIALQYIAVACLILGVLGLFYYASTVSIGLDSSEHNNGEGQTETRSTGFTASFNTQITADTTSMGALQKS